MNVCELFDDERGGNCSINIRIKKRLVGVSWKIYALSSSVSSVLMI